MMQKHFKRFIALTGLLVMVSPFVYAKNKNKGDEIKPSNLTFGMVKGQIVKGQTTQAEILQTFGPPNIMTRNRSGEEVWTYDKISSESKSSGGYGTLIILGAGGSKHSSSQKTMTLILTFNPRDVVKDYSVMATQF